MHFIRPRLMKEYRKILYNFIRSGKILSPPGACGEKMPVVKYKKRKPVCDAGISGRVFLNGKDKRRAAASRAAPPKGEKMRKFPALLLSALMLLSLAACGKAPAAAPQEPVETGAESRVIVDAAGRRVEVPETVERAVCVGVGALRYSCYVGAAERICGVEDYETRGDMSRLYNYVNFDRFKDLPVIGTNGEPDSEAIITVDPQVIVMSSYAGADPDDLSARTGIPVVVVPGSDTTLDDKAYETIGILGALYGLEDRAAELSGYLKGIQADLEKRTAGIAEEDKPAVYVAGVSFKGIHGFEGTEAHYGPLALIGANNLADTTGQSLAFDVDPEQVLSWDPDIIFLDFNGMELINEDFANNPDYYRALTAVREGRVYSQISFRSYASNLETALADAYYAASVMFPEQFADVDVEAKTGEIFEMLLGANPYDDLKEAGYAFRAITIGE